MGLFRKKKKKAHREFDPARFEPAVRSSICTGEKTAGFREKETGRFEEVMLIRSDQDLQEFMRRYGITEMPEKIY